MLRQAVLLTGRSTDFLMVFPEPQGLWSLHSSLLIHLFATNQTRDRKAQHGPYKMLNSWGAKVTNKSWLLS